MNKLFTMNHYLFILFHTDTMSRLLIGKGYIAISLLVKDRVFAQMHLHLFHHKTTTSREHNLQTRRYPDHTVE